MLSILETANHRPSFEMALVYKLNVDYQLSEKTHI